MDKVQLAAMIIAVVALIRQYVPAIDGKLVLPVAVGVGAGLGACTSLLSHADIAVGVSEGVALAIATYGAVRLVDRHADRSAPADDGAKS